MLIHPGKTSQTRPTAGIILAAGESKRMGQPKQLLQLNRSSLIERVVNAALDSDLDRVILALGYEHEKIEQHLIHRTDVSRLKIVINRRYREGLSHSLRTGLNVIKDTHSSVMFLLGDQPLIDPAAINDLLAAFRNSNKEICVPVRDEKQGNPTIFSQKFYHAIMHLQGDRGAREIIRSNPASVHAFYTKNPAYYFDIDSEADLKAWKALPERNQNT